MSQQLSINVKARGKFSGPKYLSLTFVSMRNSLKWFHNEFFKNQPSKETSLTSSTRYNLETKLSIFLIRNFVLPISDGKLLLSRIKSNWNFEWLPWGEICICQNITQFQFKRATYTTPYRLRYEIERSKPKLCKLMYVRTTFFLARSKCFTLYDPSFNYLLFC